MNQDETIAKRFRVARIVGWLFLLGFIAVLAYTYYRAEILYLGRKDAYYFSYYLISIIGILFWGMVLRLKDEVKLNIEIACTSIVVGIYMIEIVLNVTSPGATDALISSKNRIEAAKASGIDFDTRTRKEVYRDLKSEGADVAPSVRASSLERVLKLFNPHQCSSELNAGQERGGVFSISCSDATPLFKMQRRNL